MLIGTSKFFGFLPRIEGQALTPEIATQALNCKLWSGNLRPYNAPLNLSADVTLFKAAGGVIDSLYRAVVEPGDDDTAGFFFHDREVASYARSPIDGDDQWTVVISGGALAPRITDRTQQAGPDYPTLTELLGVPIPNTAGTVATVTGAPNAGADPVDRDYVVAYVNNRGQLGATSDPITLSATWSDGQEVDLTGLPGAVSGYNLVSVRIYRLGASGTNRFFVAEVPIGQATFTDNVPEISLGEQAVNGGYEPPPGELDCIGVLGNGIGYGAYRNSVALSEPYLLHAWNPLNRQPLQHDIVSMGQFGNNIVAITGENPYLIYGIAPNQMAQRKLQINQGGLSKQGAVSGVFGVAYGAKDGLVLVNHQGAQVVTEQWFTRDEWQRFAPETHKAALYADRYLAFFNRTDPLPPNPFGATADEVYIAQGLIIMDPNDSRAGLVTSDVFGTAIYADPISRNLYFVDDNGELNQWDADEGSLLRYQWKSKEFLADHRTTIKYGRVFAHSYNDLNVEFWVDGQLRHSAPVVSSEPFMMENMTNKGRTFQFRLSGTDTVTEAYFATSAREFRNL